MNSLRKIIVFLLLACAGTLAYARAQTLPARVVPSAPFPKILTQAPTIAFIAPGVTEGEYDLQTIAGPLVIHVIAVDMRRSDLHVGAVLAHDRLVSQGETVTSMALRTGAVAGINGDYFDIDNTNAPLNILVQDSQLLHPPVQRYAIGIDMANGIHFQEYNDTPPDIVTAIGGGPLLLQSGAWFQDPDGPNGSEFLQRIPASGVAASPDGTLFLVQVDGKQPSYSVGVTRPEFAALMRALGATDGMAFDGGGSSTLVARQLSNAGATLLNIPSDGHTRPVADGLFIYSDAETGPPARIAVQPAIIRAVVGASVQFRYAPVDEAGHLVGSVANGTFLAKEPGARMLSVRNGALSTRIPILVSRAPSRVSIVASATNFEAGERTQFVAKAYDKDGYQLALPDMLAWSATRGTIARTGDYLAGPENATIAVRIGGASVSTPITVGHHEAAFAIGTHLSFSAVPRDGPGTVALGDVTCLGCVLLSYDFSGNERAAYAHIEKPLPQSSIGFAFDVLGDSSGAFVRLKLINSMNESILVPATQLNFTGWHHIVVRFPATLTQPAELSSIYVLSGLGSYHITTSGTLTIRNARVLLPGSGSRAYR